MENKLFGLTEKEAKEILDKALATGGDFAEVYMQKETNDNLQMTGEKITLSSSSTIKGAALRVIKDNMEVNASITNCSYEKLLEVASKLASSFEGTRKTEVLPFKEVKTKKVVNPIRVNTENKDFEINMLKEGGKAITNYSKEIVQ